MPLSPEEHVMLQQLMEKAKMSSSVLLSSDGGSRAATMVVSP